MKRETKKDCDTCLHEDKNFKYEHPCKECIEEVEINKVPSRWTPKKEDTDAERS
jgi:hypothetical protein